MTRALRFVKTPYALFEITTRTIQSRFLLKPSKKLNNLILGVIGRALYLYPEIRLHILVVASNHFQAIASTPDAKTKARFMGHINSNIAKEAGRLYNWKDKFWSRRYTAIAIEDDESLIDKFKYILAHGAKEGLVLRPGDWPGVNCVAALIRGKTLSGTWYDRSNYYRDSQKAKDCNLSDYTIEYDIPLSPLPCLADKTEEERTFVYRAILAEIENETQDRIRSTKVQPLGRKAVLAQDPHGRPRHSKKNPKPWCHAKDKKTRQAFKQAYKSFEAAYRLAADRLRQGMSARFPEGCFPPAPAFAAREIEIAFAPG
jgi:REP-associated tyrosine transposase